MKPIFVLVLAVFLCFAPPAAAQTEQQKAQARQLFKEGKQYFAQNKYRAAINMFKRAYAIWPRKEIQLNIAMAYYNLGNAVKVVTHLRGFLQKASPRERKVVPKALMGMRQKVGIVVVQMPNPDAEIRINGKLEGQGRVELVVKPGPVSIAVSLKGKVVAQKRLRVEAGTHRVWELSQIPKEPTRGSGGSTGGETGTGGGTGTGAGLGTEGGRGMGGGAKGGSGLQKLHWAYFAAATGLAVVSAAVVAGIGVKTLQIKEDYDDNPSDSLKDKGRTYRTATNAMIGVTAAAAAGAVVLAIFTRWSSPKEQASAPAGEVTVRPIVAPTSVGIQVRY